MKKWLRVFSLMVVAGFALLGCENGDVQYLKGKVEGLEVGLNATNGRVGHLNVRLTTVEGEVKDLTVSTATLASRTAEIENAFPEFKNGLAALNETIYGEKGLVNTVGTARKDAAAARRAAGGALRRVQQQEEISSSNLLVLVGKPTAQIQKAAGHGKSGYAVSAVRVYASTKEAADKAGKEYLDALAKAKVPMETGVTPEWRASHPVSGAPHGGVITTMTK